jgi:excisionase family DNA binding protein
MGYFDTPRLMGKLISGNYLKRDTVYKWIADKALPAHKIGRLWKFKKDEVDHWVRTGNAKNE